MKKVNKNYIPPYTHQEIIDWISSQKKIFKYYKKACKEIENAIQSVKNKKILLKRGKFNAGFFELYIGFDWFTEKSEIHRFFCAREKSQKQIPEYVKYLDSIKSQMDKVSEEIKTDMKLDIGAFDLAKEIQDGITIIQNDENIPYLKRIESDIINKRLNYLYDEYLPELITLNINKLFKDNKYIFHQFKTFNTDKLQNEKNKIYGSIYEETINLFLKKFEFDEFAETEDYKSVIHESIKIQFGSLYGMDSIQTNDKTVSSRYKKGNYEKYNASRFAQVYLNLWIKSPAGGAPSLSSLAKLRGSKTSWYRIKRRPDFWDAVHNQLNIMRKKLPEEKRESFNLIEHLVLVIKDVFKKHIENKSPISSDRMKEYSDEHILQGDLFDEIKQQENKIDKSIDSENLE